MDWIKIPTDEILLSDRKDWQNYALIKYMALYCQLERQPSDIQLQRILNKKQLDYVKADSEVVMKLIQSCIEVVSKKRRQNKIQYEKKCSKNNGVLEIQTSDSNLSGEADKIRIDKKKEIDKEKAEKEYAFEGDVIKLNKKDFDAWQKKYYLLDLPFELEKRDIWLSGQEKVGNWFISTKQYLLTLQKKKADEKKEDEEYKQRMCKSWWRE